MRCSSLALLALGLVAAPLRAQAPAVYDARLAPDGRTIALRHADGAGIRLSLLAVGDSLSHATPLTPAGVRVGRYWWAPDGRTLAFASRGTGHLYAVSPEGAGRPPRDLTPDLEGAARLAGWLAEPAAALVELPGEWPERPDLYRVSLVTGERTRVATNDGGVSRWLVDGQGALRAAVRPGEDGSTELVRVRGTDLVPVYVCPAGATCDLVDFHPDGRWWVRSNGNRDATALLLVDPLSGRETVARANVAGDPETAFYSDSLYQRDTARLRALLGPVALQFHPGTADGALMLVTARRDSTTTAYLFDRWAGTTTALFPLAVEPGTGPTRTDAAVLQPDPAQLRNVQLRYEVTENDVSSPAGEFERRIERRSARGSDVWRVIDAADVPVYDDLVLDTAALLADPTREPPEPEPRGMTKAADTTIVDAVTLRPRARRAGGPVAVRLDFGTDGVTGLVESGGEETAVDTRRTGGLWASGAALDLMIAALPLAEGYETTLALFDVDALDTATVRIAVTGSERIRTPAGAYDAWRVTITPIAGDGPTHDWLVLRDGPHYVLRATMRWDDLIRSTELVNARGLR